MTKSRPELSEDERELIKAAGRGDKEKVIELLAKNTNPNAVDEGGYTPLMRFLLCFAADRYSLNKRDIQVAKILLDHGAKTDKCCNIGGGPFHLVLSRDDFELFQLLLPYTTNFDTTDENGTTALTVAVQKSNMPAVKELVARKADPNKCGLYGGPLHEAATKNSSSLVDILTKAGAEVNAKGLVSCTPVHKAALENRTDMVKKLIALGANLDLSDKFGGPLHAMVSHGNLPLIKYCLNRGADPRIVKENGATPSQAARAGNNQEIATLLEKFEKLYSLTTTEINIDEIPLITSQLPNQQDLEPENLDGFTARFLKNLLNEMPQKSQEKIERFKSNLNLLMQVGYYPELIDGLTVGIRPSLTVFTKDHAKPLAIAAAQAVVNTLPKDKKISSKLIDTLPVSPLDHKIIKTVAGIPLPKPSNGPSR